jgi:sec-independent protein translocase protein TatA
MAVGPWQIVIIALIVLLLFGASRLSEIGKGLGEGIRNFKKGIEGGDDKDDDDEDDKPAKKKDPKALKAKKKKIEKQAAEDAEFEDADEDAKA